MEILLMHTSTSLAAK